MSREQKIEQWDNPIEFLMTCIGFAVGIGGVIRFPFLCFENGGCAFVIAFLFMLFFFGVPLFFLELTISQYSKCGADKVWRIIPIFRGLGLCSVFTNTFFCIYFNVLICYSVIYLVASFFPNLPWVGCDNWWNDENCISAVEKNLTVSTSSLNASISFDTLKNITLIPESASKQFFNNFVLEISDGVDNPNGFNYKVVASLALCWIAAFLSLIKGIQSLGKISYFTAIFPYIMITVLIIRGVTLPGALKGLEFYILRLDMDKLLTLKTWIDASSQALFCLGIAQGGLLTLGKHNKFNYNHQRATLFIALLDGFTGVYAGFAIFSVLGFMAESTGQEVQDLTVGGLGLSFIVYPEALALMPFPWIWCIFFFMMMITIGFGSLLSMTECCLDTLCSILNVQKKYIKTIRFCTCLLFFLVGLTMTTRGGYYIVNLIDSYVCTIPIILIATFEAIGLGWLYGIRRIEKNIRLMLNTNLNLYWKLCIKYITPTVSITMLIITLVCNTEVVLNSYHYPAWAHYMGYTIVCFCIAPLIFGFFREIINGGFLQILSDSSKPCESWEPAFDNPEQGDNEMSRNLTNSNPAMINDSIAAF